jgi:hypothetical protein
LFVWLAEGAPNVSRPYSLRRASESVKTCERLLRESESHLKRAAAAETEVEQKRQRLREAAEAAHLTRQKEEVRSILFCVYSCVCLGRMRKVFCHSFDASLRRRNGISNVFIH